MERFPLLTPSEHITIDKQLSHFTTERRMRKTHPLGRFAARSVDAIAQLARQADAPWQDSLRTIHAKAEGELKRSREAWNAS